MIKGVDLTGAFTSIAKEARRRLLLCILLFETDIAGRLDVLQAGLRAHSRAGFSMPNPYTTD